MYRILIVILIVFLLAAPPAHAAQAHVVPTPSPVASLSGSSGDVIIETEDGVGRLTLCDAPPGLCFIPAPPAKPRATAPKGALPDGQVAEAATGDIASAWYAEPTGRYAHGVLGDAIEGGALAAVGRDGSSYYLRLPQDQVFEDITPRIADLDGDGSSEIVTIRSSLSGGAALAIYGLRNGQLVQVAATPEIGRTNRWLNVAGIGAPDEDGARPVFIVRTPHIGGVLTALKLRGGVLETVAGPVAGVTNHVIGSRVLDMAAVVDAPGAQFLVLPSQDRTRLLGFDAGLNLLFAATLPGRADKSLAATNGRVVTATEDGSLVVLDPRPLP